MISALLLAAGSSRRFNGSPKLLHDLAGKPIVRWSAELALSSPVDEVVVVVAPAREGDMRSALDGLALRFVANERAADGMGASLACGVGALATSVEAALVFLADEPRVPVESAVKVVGRYRAGGATIVAPAYRGIRGHPVLFHRSVFPELLALNADRGARAVADRDPARLAILELDQAKPLDVDSPEDLARLRAEGPVGQNMSLDFTRTHRK